MPHVIAYTGHEWIAPDNSQGDLFIFWSLAYRRLLVVQALGQYAAFMEEEHAQSWEKQCLEEIQSCINAMDFEREDTWAYLVTTASGPRIIQKPRKLYEIPCDFLWAPRVDISEIDVQKMNEGFGLAVWRGRQVDVRIAFNDNELWQVECETRALKDVQHLDIAYGLVAHVFRGEKLIGIMRESAQASRPVQASDRAAVFAAFALLESAFMVNSSLINEDHIVMDEKGRVRMLYLRSIRLYGREEREELERDAQMYHWEPLREFFDLVTNPAVEVRWPTYLIYPSSTYLAPTPSPERFMAMPLRFDVHACIQLEEIKKKHRRRKGVSKTPRSGGHALEPLKATTPNIDRPDTPAKLGTPHVQIHVFRVADRAEDSQSDKGGSVVEEEERVDGGGFIVEV
ncbi:hypothetical protein FB45DRAFT_948254 [Roridomyces roridus]|uniref:Uncharacterized protein n=1 Tax=Roridomyces roridus TaxID=1738132 RepID=A0AAD7B126_9AGAR|nr:hypothetical protein FB45DRAFT_948254 [Roridomyces roridus]